MHLLGLQLGLPFFTAAGETGTLVSAQLVIEGGTPTSRVNATSGTLSSAELVIMGNNPVHGLRSYDLGNFGVLLSGLTFGVESTAP